MRVVFTPHGWAEYMCWLTADRHNVKRVNRGSNERPLPRESESTDEWLILNIDGNYL